MGYAALMLKDGKPVSVINLKCGLYSVANSRLKRVEYLDSQIRKLRPAIPVVKFELIEIEDFEDYKSDLKELMQLYRGK